MPLTALQANVKMKDEEPPPTDIKPTIEGIRMGRRVRSVLDPPGTNRNMEVRTLTRMLSGI